jgi:nucleotide-binding universal stress UspA family protein
MAIRRILAGLDGSALAETILSSVQLLAGRIGAEVVLLHVTHVPEEVRTAGPGPAVDEIVAEEQSKAKTYLAEVAERLRASSLTVDTALVVGDAATEIVRYAKSERIDLIALATHGRSGFRRWLHGSVADAVLHQTTTPLLLLQPESEGSATRLVVRRVVVPLDGSEVAEVALPVAEELARAFGVQVALLRVVEVVGLAFAGDPVSGAYVNYQALLNALRDQAERYLDGLAQKVREKGLEVAFETQLGLPADVIAGEARDRPGSLIVMATHGRTGWRRMLLGSVARRVVLKAGGPVLVVPPAGVSERQTGGATSSAV